MARSRDEVTWFATPAEWRTWLEANHETATELWVGMRKKHVTEGIVWQEVVDEALCFGWIDGLANAVDADGYACRVTPRRPRSIWSAVNLRRIEELIAEGRVHESGLRVYQTRDVTRTGLYAGEQDEIAFDPEQEATFRANVAAWDWFQTQPPGYRRQATWWVISAKRPETRARRLAQLIEGSAAGRRLL